MKHRGTEGAEENRSVAFKNNTKTLCVFGFSILRRSRSLFLTRLYRFLPWNRTAYFHLGVCGSVFLLTLLISVNTLARQTTGFLDQVLIQADTEYRYQVYLPPHWTSERSWPVILFLHGAGERGSNGLLQTDVGLAKRIRTAEKPFPAIVVFPQVKTGGWWSDLEMEKLAMNSLNYAIEKYNGDRQRVYASGLSMGGYGVWHLASKYPNTFAALIPICGRLRPPGGIKAAPASVAADEPDTLYYETARRIGTMPIWVFHGARDEIVPVEESRQIVSAFQKQGSSIHYTEYEDLGHTVWDRAYFEPGLFEWLFSQHQINTKINKTQRHRHLHGSRWYDSREGIGRVESETETESDAGRQSRVHGD